MTTDLFLTPVTSERVADGSGGVKTTVRATPITPSVEEFFLDSVSSVFGCRARVYSDRFRPCISSLGHFRKFCFRDISTCVSRSDTKLNWIIDTDTVYPHSVSDSELHFRFRHRAPLKNFRFLNFSPKRRPLAGTVVPRFKLLVHPYKMGDQVGP